jgi:hypothetical protein
MKKIIVLLVLLMVPVLAFAQLWVGGVGMYESTLDNLKAGNVSASDFTYGLEGRLSLGVFQGGLTALYFPGYIPEWDMAAIMADAGLSVNLLFVRVGLGAGPNYLMYLDSTSPSDAMPFGVNLKASADIEFGYMSVGLVGYYLFNNFKELLKADYSSAVPYLGVSVLFQLL